jgi:phage shock protein C
MAEHNKRLYRSSSSKMLGGVCGGVAEYFGIDPTIIRVIYVVLSVFTAAFPGILLYIICLIIIPQDPGYTDI